MYVTVTEHCSPTLLQPWFVWVLVDKRRTGIYSELVQSHVLFPLCPSGLWEQVSIAIRSEYLTKVKLSFCWGSVFYAELGKKCHLWLHASLSLGGSDDGFYGTIVH